MDNFVPVDQPIDPMVRLNFENAKRTMSVGVQIRLMREQRRWSQAELSVRSGVSRQSICQIEKGHTWPSFQTIYELSHCMGLFVLVELVPFHRLLTRADAFSANLQRDKIEELRPEGLSGGQFGW